MVPARTPRPGGDAGGDTPGSRRGSADFSSAGSRRMGTTVTPGTGQRRRPAIGTTRPRRMGTTLTTRTSRWQRRTGRPGRHTTRCRRMGTTLTTRTSRWQRRTGRPGRRTTGRRRMGTTRSSRTSRCGRHHGPSRRGMGTADSSGTGGGRRPPAAPAAYEAPPVEPAAEAWIAPISRAGVPVAVTPKPATERTDLYVCTGCGIGEALDAERLAAVGEAQLKRPGSVHGPLCIPEGVAALREGLAAAEASRVVIAACSERVNHDVFSPPPSASTWSAG